ncbi:MAG: Trm112 family protein [Candidatus Thermoplasmatota archaeon]
MKESLLDILRCPECKGELDLTVEKQEEEIEKGTLYC